MTCMYTYDNYIITNSIYWYSWEVYGAGKNYNNFDYNLGNIILHNFLTI